MTADRTSPSAPKQRSSGPDLSALAELRFRDAQPWQRSLRWAVPPRDRRLFRLGLAAALLATLLELTGLAVIMKPVRSPRAAATPIQVVSIDLEQEFPIPPEPVPPAIVTRPSKIAVEPPKIKTPPPPPRPAEDSDGLRARIGEAGSAAPPVLFNPDGSIRMNDVAPVAPVAPKTEREAALARWSSIEKGGKNLLNCRKSKLAGGYAPDESVGSGVARKYLSWVGLYDPHDTQKRAQRAEQGCDPVE